MRVHCNVALHVGIQCQNSKRALIALNLKHAGFKCKRHNCSQHVAAVGRGVDRLFVGLQLGKQKVKRHTRHFALAHNANFAG